MVTDQRNYLTPSFSIPEEMLERLEEIAQREDRSLSSVVRRAIRLYEKRESSLDDPLLRD